MTLTPFLAVTDDVVEIVRAYPEVDEEGFRRRLHALDASKNLPFQALIDGAFIAAVQRKFNRRSSREEIIEYVARVRSRDEELAGILEPSATERMIAFIHAGDDIDDIDQRLAMNIEMFIAVAIVTDKGISGRQLDDLPPTRMSAQPPPRPLSVSSRMPPNA